MLALRRARLLAGEVTPPPPPPPPPWPVLKRALLREGVPVALLLPLPPALPAAIVKPPCGCWGEVLCEPVPEPPCPCAKAAGKGVRRACCAMLKFAGKVARLSELMVPTSGGAWACTLRAR